MASQAARQPGKTPRGGRRLAFTLVALALPVLFVGGAELVLRAGEAGALEPLFIQDASHPEWSLANPKVVGRFFSSPEQAPGVSIETGFFRSEKPRGGIRIVVQGGSSAAGFPYGYGASLAGMLEQRLRREFPGREIEVVTTAMAAVNSYALVEFADEILAIEPDAILVYAGHNEFLGILGVGSAYTAARSPALTRLILKLRHLRLYRVIEQAIAPAAPPGGLREGGTLMARVAAERRIPMDSALYEAGADQFRSNLAVLLGRYREAGVPVFVATLASNERDQAPFSSTEPAETAAALDEAEALLLVGEGARALGLARRAAEAEPGSARAAWVLANALAATGDGAGAATAWRRARDLDELRFRAPSRFREIIEEAAAAHGAHLVDVEAVFREASPFRAVGRELMLEHLHPNVDGYFLLADAFHDRLVETGIVGAGGEAVDDATARAEVPLSAAEVRFGEYKLARLMNDWPFTETRGEPTLPPPAGLEDQLAQGLYRQEIAWPAMQDRLKRAYRSAGNAPEYLRLSLILADAFPFVAEAQRDAGEALLAAGRVTQAYRYFFRAVAYAPLDPAALKGLARAATRLGLEEEARKALERLLEARPGDAEARRMLDALAG